MGNKKKRRTWRISGHPRARCMLRIDGTPVTFHFPLATLAKFAERALSEVAGTFDFGSEGIKVAAVALAVKTAMIAHEEAAMRQRVIKEESDAYLLVILYCWQIGLFAPDLALFPYRFEEVLAAFSEHSKIDLSLVETAFARGGL